MSRSSLIEYWEIPVEFTAVRTYKIPKQTQKGEEVTLQYAIDCVYGAIDIEGAIPMPSDNLTGEYVDDSLKINRDCLIELNELENLEGIDIE